MVVTEKVGNGGTSASSGVRVYENIAALKEILPAWEELLDACPDASIFSTWEWLSSWWEAFGGALKLNVATFWDDRQRLQALAPLAIGSESIPFGFRLSALHLMGDGSGDSDNLGIVVRPGCEAEFAEGLLRHLEDRSAAWDIGHFNTVDPRASWLKHFRAALARHGWSAVLLSRPWCTVSLPQTWDAYLERLSAKERRKIGVRTRRLERRYEVCCRCCRDLADLPAWLDALFDLHGRRWDTRGETGSFRSPERRRFYGIMAARFLERGWLDFSQLLLDGQVAATQFSFRYRGTEYSLQEGYDPRYSSDSVGYVLRACNLRRLIGEGVLRYDFLGGRDDSKERWGAAVGRYLDLHFARRPSLAALHLRGMHGVMRARGWLRERLR